MSSSELVQILVLAVFEYFDINFKISQRVDIYCAIYLFIELHLEEQSALIKPRMTKISQKYPNHGKKLLRSLHY
jgi:hypothetical protein